MIKYIPVFESKKQGIQPYAGIVCAVLHKETGEITFRTNNFLIEDFENKIFQNLHRCMLLDEPKISKTVSQRINGEWIRITLSENHFDEMMKKQNIHFLTIEISK